jgi:hypothetical protein
LFVTLSAKTPSGPSLSTSSETLLIMWDY